MMKHLRRRVGLALCIAGAAVITGAPHTRAEVRPAGIFADNMVLQCDRPIPIWGTSDPGQPITVRFANQEVTAKADSDGRWKAFLGPVTATATGQTLEIRGSNTIRFDRVVVGEVWHASGQSNMAMTVGAMTAGLGPDGASRVGELDFSAIRFARIREPHAAHPRSDLTDRSVWTASAPDTTPGFSAVAFVFARRLHLELGHPIGVIDSSWGGKPIESFIPARQYEAADHPALILELELAKRRDFEGLRRMTGGVYARDDSWFPGAIFNGRLAPIAPFAIRGVIWYQGESNCGVDEDPTHYRHKMRLLIEGWRAARAGPGMPFYFVQLPGYSGAAPGWPALREEQRLSLSKNTGMAVTIDIDSPGIHPPNKIDVGERLAKWPLARDYGASIPFSGPLYSSHEIRGGRIVVSFSHAEHGIRTGVKAGTQPFRETPGTAPRTFEVAGADGIWHAARAEIRNDKVEVASVGVPEPRGVRYAYHIAPDRPNLYNVHGLPASPFTSESTDSPDYWAIEDRAERASFPEYRTIPAARPEALTPAAGWPDEAAYTEWDRSHGDPSGSRYSALKQIHRGNVARLEPAWIYRSGDGPGNIQCNPIIVDGLMFAPTSGDAVVAIDAGSGRERWRFKDWGRVGLGSRPAYRGLNFWRGADGESPRLLFCANGSLYALDPVSGTPISGFGENGRVSVGAVTSVAGIYRDTLVLPGFDRDVSGYDLVSGRKRWTFQTIPSGSDPGASTWDRPGSGANCWGGMAIDARRGIAYISTGSPKPNFTGVGHRGRNLFANSVVALDALTGERRWHFQEIRHDIWDLDIPAPPNLVTVRRHGRSVDAVAQVTKLGNTLLLDRLTGEPLFPFRLRRAPVSDLPGEVTWPYQPDLELPEPFARQEFTRDDLTDISRDAHDAVLARIDQADFGWFQPFKNGRPLVFYGIHGGAEWTGACFDPESGFLYVSANELPWIITVDGVDRPTLNEAALPVTPGRTLYLELCAACHGPNREGVGANPTLQFVHERRTPDEVRGQLATGINAMPSFVAVPEIDREHLVQYLFERSEMDAGTAPNSPETRPERPRYRSNGYPKLLDHEGYPGSKPPWGTLNCLDLNTGKRRWSVPLGEYPALTRRGIPVTGTENFGGPIVTAGGLVFCAGTRDERIRAFDKDTGAELWSHKLPFGGYAPPATYLVNGRQYVVIAATGGGKLGGATGDVWIAFALKDPS